MYPYYALVSHLQPSPYSAPLAQIGIDGLLYVWQQKHHYCGGVMRHGGPVQIVSQVPLEPDTRDSAKTIRLCTS